MCFLSVVSLNVDYLCNVMIDTSGWDPKLIVMQITAIQLGYYAVMGTLALILDGIFGAPIDLQQLFSVKLPFFTDARSSIAMVIVLLSAPIGHVMVFHTS